MDSFVVRNYITRYLNGLLKQLLITHSLCIGLLLSSLESTIVATALVSIASDFNDYGRSNWVVIAYLLTYSSRTPRASMLSSKSQFADFAPQVS